MRDHYKIVKKSQATYDFLVALAIGVGLAGLLVAWWSS